MSADRYVGAVEASDWCGNRVSAHAMASVASPRPRCEGGGTEH